MNQGIQFPIFLPLVGNSQFHLPEHWALCLRLIAECKPEKNDGQQWGDTKCTAKVVTVKVKVMIIW